MDLVAQNLQREVYDTLGLYVTVGMGDNPLLAKLAMDNYAKHTLNMRSLIRYEDVPEKVWILPKMTDFWGIGKGLEKRFNKLGIHSIKELATANPNVIKQKMGLIGLQEFFHANGIDETNVREKHIKKSSSYSNSQILPRDYTIQFEIELIIKEMTETLSIGLRKGHKLATTIHLMVRFSYQEKQSTINVSSKIEPSQNTVDLQYEFISLFKKKYKGGAVRQIGVSASNLTSENFKQLSLFDTVGEDERAPSKKEEALQKAIDEIRETFDFSSIQKASALTKGSRTLARNKMIGGHSASQPPKEKKNDR